MSRNNVRLVLTLVALIVMVRYFDRRSDPGSTPKPTRDERAAQQLDQELTPAAAVEQKEGLAAAIVIVPSCNATPGPAQASGSPAASMISSTGASSSAPMSTPAEPSCAAMPSSAARAIRSQ